MHFILLKVIYISTYITFISITSILTITRTYFICPTRTSSIKSTNSTLLIIYIIIANISFTHLTFSTNNTNNISSISKIILFICIIVASNRPIRSTYITSTNIIIIIYIIIFISLSKKLI